MTARPRRNDEEFGDYRDALKYEARVERVKLKGRWMYRSYMSIRTKENELKNIKTPPYRKPKEKKDE